MPELRRTPSNGGMSIGFYEGDERLAGLWVGDFCLRIGDRPIRFGGIGGVGSHRDHRGQGYARQVLDDAIAYMQEVGYPLSVLFGIPNFYPKWGFASTLIETTLEIETGPALQAASPLVVRPMQADDLPALLALYAQGSGTRTGTMVRGEQFKGYRFGAHWKDNVAVIVAEERGQVVGYLVYNSEPWDGRVAEVGGSRAAMCSLLHHMAEMMAARHRGKIVFELPPDHAFASCCTELGCKLSIEYTRAAGGMARIIDQAALLAQVEPLLLARLEASACAWRGTLTLRTQLGSTPVQLGGTENQTVGLQQEALVQLLFGYRSVEQVRAAGELDCSPELDGVLTALFPQGYPYMWHPDRF